jgi:transposase InsO family protein
VAALIAAQRVEHGIPAAVTCRALGVSRSWYYKWRGGTLPPRAERRQQLKAEVARSEVAAWIEDDNTNRRHSALGMRSPVAYEHALAAKEVA